MNKKEWIIFWLIALLLLFFVCIFSHKDDMVVKSALAPVVQKAPEAEPIKIEPVVTPKKKEYGDITLKMTKDGNSLLLSGELNSKSDLENITSNYGNVKVQDIKFNKDVKNQNIISTIISLKDLSKKFKSGYMEYVNGTLTIDGIVSSEDDKNLIESTLASINGIKVNKSIVVEQPKQDVEHISKLSVVKVGNDVTVSGAFSSENELEQLIALLKNKGLNVSKGTCVIDSGLKTDGWKIPVAAVLDQFVNFTKGSIQFDKNIFEISGITTKDGDKEEIHTRLDKVKGNLVITEDVTFEDIQSKIKKAQEKVSQILKLKHIRFITNTAELIDESKPVLNEVIEILSTLPNIKVEIDGYTDSDGDKNKNLILSQKRADSVREYLIEHGINGENLIAIGFGEANPIVKNNSDENKQLNRRVEFKIIGE